MRKVSLDGIKTDDTADAVYDKMEAELTELVANNRFLQNQLDERATDGGDLIAMLELQKLRNEDLESRLRGEVALASPNGKAVSTPKGAAAVGNPEAEKWGLKLLQAHGGLVNATEDTVDLIVRLRDAGGDPLVRFVTALVENIEDRNDQIVIVNGTPMPDSLVQNERFNSEVRRCYEQLLVNLLGKLPSGNPSHQVSLASAEITKLKAIPLNPGTSEGDELYTLLTGKLAHDPKKESVTDYLTRVETSLRGQGVTLFLDACGNDPKVNVKRTSKESNEDYLARLIKAGAVGGGDIGDFLDKLGKDTTINVPRNAGETDSQYANRIFLAARDYYTTWTNVSRMAMDTLYSISDTDNKTATAMVQEMLAKHTGAITAIERLLTRNGLPTPPKSGTVLADVLVANLVNGHNAANHSKVTNRSGALVK